MKQYESCIQIIIIINIKKKRIKVKRKKQRRTDGGRARIEKEIFYFFSSFRFSLKSTKMGLQVFVGAKNKVDPCITSYVWVPKSLSFVKLYDVGNFSTCVISNLKDI